MVVKNSGSYLMNEIYFLNEDVQNIKNVVAYARKSRGIGDKVKVDNADVLKKQRERVHRICEQFGWHLTYFEEIGSGGSLKDRKEMQKLQEYVRTNTDKVDMVLAFDVDRLGRDDDMIPFYTFLREEEIFIGDSSEDKIFDLNENNDKTYFDMKTLFAGMEYRKNKIRNKEHRQIAFKNGQFLGGVVPFPYVFNDVTKGLDIIEEYKEIYYDIVDKFLKGWSYTSLAEILDNHKIPTPQKRTNKWDYNAIQTILISEVHRGMLVVKGYKNPKGEYIRLPQEEWGINYNPKWKALIDQNLSDKILSEYFKRKRKNKKSANQTHSLSGLVFCALCGSKLTINKTANDELSLRKCTGGKENKGCNNRGGKATIIERDIMYFLEMIIDDLQEREVATKTIAEKIEYYRKSISGYEAEIKNKEKLINNTRGMLAEMWSVFTDEQKEEEKAKMQKMNEEILIDKSEIKALQEEIFLLENKKEMSSVERYKTILQKLKLEENPTKRNRKYKEFIHKIYWEKTEETLKFTLDLNMIS